MTDFTQENRLLRLATPLGADVLLPVALRGHEQLSCLFTFELELAAELGTRIPFDRILGQSVSLELRHTGESHRFFNGIVVAFGTCGRTLTFARYHATLAPKLWLLTKTRRSRVFQNLSTPDILRRVLEGYDVSFKLSVKYLKRTYCVQYQESDFAFISRLMEEDGITYRFLHTDSGHTMVLSDAVTAYPRIAADRDVILGNGPGRSRTAWQLCAWRATQCLSTRRFTVRDHSFHLPNDPLEATLECLQEVRVGRAAHRLIGAAKSEKPEVYEYPGGYAKWHDRPVSHDGTADTELGGLFEDRDRLLRLRVEAEEGAAMRIEGGGNCAPFTPGTIFELAEAGESSGQYLLTRVDHVARNGGWGSGETDVEQYENQFTCQTADICYRPERSTTRPIIPGVQTATVVGPSNANMFCDGYGRVKVQFPWDREGRHDAGSSCWLRVAQIWAGDGWGAFFWPRIGHEVVVAFENGDPDCPMIIGSVYNAANMPPYTMPARQDLGGIRSASSSGSAHQHFNSVVFNDEKGSEHLSIHSERNLSLNSECDKMIRAGRHKGERVPNSSILAVGSLPGAG